MRDEDTGELWGPTALPIRDEAAPYVARHGQGYSRFEHAAHGIALDLLQYVPLDDPIKISRLTIRNTSRPAAAALGHGLRRVGARPVARRVGALRRDRDRSGDRRDVRAQPVEHRRSARASPSPTSAAGRPPGPATGGSSSAATARSPTRPRWRATTPLSQRRRRRPRSLRRPAGAGRARAGRDGRDRLLPRRGGDRGRRASPDRALSRGRSRRGPARGRRALGRRARHGPGEDARPVDGHHAEPLAALPDARLPHLGALGVLPGERRLRLPRPAAGRHGARRCRDRR